VKPGDEVSGVHAAKRRIGHSEGQTCFCLLYRLPGRKHLGAIREFRPVGLEDLPAIKKMGGKEICQTPVNQHLGNSSVRNAGGRVGPTLSGTNQPARCAKAKWNCGLKYRLTRRSTRKEKTAMAEKAIIAYEEGAVLDMIKSILDVLKDFSEEDLKAWVKDQYPDPEEIYG